MLNRQEERRPWTVSELARNIQAELTPLKNIFVKGEVSGMKQSAKGHFSFAIKDGLALIEAFIWANDARKLAMLPEDGQEMIFRGRVDFWPQGGRIRLVVDYVEFDDVGQMRAKLELLKQRLEMEGAFSAERKRPLPFLPRAVALVTSPTGAVIHDLQQTIWDRYPNMDIVVYPATVQGANAPSSVAWALRWCNREARADVVIVARGGGSFEELYAFNSEVVVRAVLASKIPVVTALGHTSDRTLADMAADAECRTPTEAGARVVPRKADLMQGLAERSRRLEREFSLRLQAVSEAVAQRRGRLAAVLPKKFAERAERIRKLRLDLQRLSPVQQLARRAAELSERGRRLLASSDRLLARRQAELSRRRDDGALVRLLGERISRLEREVGQRRLRLEAMSPRAVLARGYSITRDVETGRLLTEVSATAPGRKVSVQLSSGRLAAVVEAVQEEPR